MMKKILLLSIAITIISWTCVQPKLGTKNEIIAHFSTTLSLDTKTILAQWLVYAANNNIQHDANPALIVACSKHLTPSGQAWATTYAHHLCGLSNHKDLNNLVDTPTNEAGFYAALAELLAPTSATTSAPAPSDLSTITDWEVEEEEIDAIKCTTVPINDGQFDEHGNPLHYQVVQADGTPLPPQGS